MKRKIFSILLALVLVLSFSLVTAVPAGAQGSYPGLKFQVEDISSPAVGTASWAEDIHSGNYAVHLSTGTPDALEAVDSARVVLPYNQTLSTITEVGYSYKLIAGRPANDSAPYIYFELDTDDDSTKDTWVIHHLFSTAAEDTWGTWLLSTDTVDPAWHAVGTKTTGTPYTDWAAVKAAFDDDMVLNIKIAVGEWDSDHLESHHVDDFQLNGTTYDLEQPAAVWVDATDGDDGNTGIETEPFLTIQYAIDILASNCIINVAAGTYAEDLDILAGKDNLELVGATGATIKGVATAPDASWPAGIPNIDILADGVKIHGFTIQSPDAVADQYASGMLIGASDVEIYDNTFTTHTQDTGQYSVVIQTYRKVVLEGVDISGLKIHDNTFDSVAVTTVGYDGIFVNIDTGTGPVTIANNEFTGSLIRAIAVERSIVAIANNTIVTDSPVGFPGGHQGIFVGCYELTENGNDGPVQSNVVIIHNTVKGSGEGDGFTQGIRVGHSTEQIGFSDILIFDNTVEGNVTGVIVKARAGATPVDVVINYNSIVDNDIGVSNQTVDEVLIDAENNWWGDIAGPNTSTKTTLHNPYEGWTSGDAIGEDIDYLPWMIRFDLAKGWNIVSFPIMSEEPVEPPPTPEEMGITAVYWFDSSTQYWNYDPYQAGPLDAMYMKSAGPLSFMYPVSSEPTFPGVKEMKVGWNFIGLAQLYQMYSNDALSDALFGTGETGLFGYSRVLSPSLNGDSWSYVLRGDEPEMMYPLKGYWVLMVNDGVLGGFTETPIVEVEGGS